MIYIHLVLNQEFCMGLPKSIMRQKMEYHHFVQFYQQQEHLPINYLNFVTNYSNHLQIMNIQYKTLSFAKEVLEFDASLFMTIFDIKSLFTNIPLAETLNLCVQSLYRNQTRVGNLTKSSFYSLLKITIFESCFIISGKFYEQSDGVAMGSPLGPTLANVFMCHFENIWLENCPTHFKPIVYGRFVDDIFLLFSKKGSC